MNPLTFMKSAISPSQSHSERRPRPTTSSRWHDGSLANRPRPGSQAVSSRLPQSVEASRLKPCRYATLGTLWFPLRRDTVTCAVSAGCRSRSATESSSARPVILLGGAVVNACRQKLTTHQGLLQVKGLLRKKRERGIGQIVNVGKLSGHLKSSMSCTKAKRCGSTAST